MKKEKTVKTYQRRTKSGKVVTVRQHTAKYDAAEKAMEAAKKKGAGDELKARMSKLHMKELLGEAAPTDEEVAKYKEDVKARVEEASGKEQKKKEKKVRPVGSGTNGPTPKKKSEAKSKTDKVLDWAKGMYSHNNPSGSKNSIAVYLQKHGYSFKEAQSKANSIERAAKKERKSLMEQGHFPTTQKSKTKSKTTSASASSPTFTAAEFKEWYRGTGSAADKKVAKALRAQLGRSGYRKLEDEAIDNYSSRGHLSMFKRVSSGSEAPTKKETAKSSTGKKSRQTPSSTSSKSASSKEPLIKDPFERAELISALKSKGKGHFNRVKMSSKYGEYFTKGSWNPSKLGKQLLAEEAALNKVSTKKTSSTKPATKVNASDEAQEALRGAKKELRGYGRIGLSSMARKYGKDSKEYKGWAKLKTTPIPKDSKKAAVRNAVLQGFDRAGDDTIRDLLVAHGYPHTQAYSKGIPEVVKLAKKYGIDW